MKLTSITVPCLAKDVEAFRRLLAYWSDPRLFPLRPGEDLDPLYLIVVLNRLDEQIAAQFRGAFEQARELHGVFRECVVFGAGLEGERDLYVRNSVTAQGKYGNKAGPNFLFFSTMRLLEPFGGFTFQNELDCYPLRRGWLTDLATMIDMRRYAWVIGSMFTATPPVGHEIQFHLNGNAVYQSGSRDFIKFIDKVWEPRLSEYVDIYPNLAYDCWWALEQTRANSIIKNTSWQLVSTYQQYFCNSQFLINTLSPDMAVKDAREALRVSTVSRQKCIFVHGHAITSLVQEFYASKANDLRDFIVKRAADQGEQSGEIEGSNQDVGSISVNWDEVWSPVVSDSSRIPKSTLGDKLAAIAVPRLPFQLSPASIPDECFVGDWHQRYGQDHVWTSKGKAALSFRFLEPVKRLRILLNGTMAPGLNWEKIHFHALGGKDVVVDTNATSNTVSFVISDASLIDACTIVFDVSEASRVEGDSRELGFVLFHIQVNEE